MGPTDGERIARRTIRRYNGEGSHAGVSQKRREINQKVHAARQAGIFAGQHRIDLEEGVAAFESTAEKNAFRQAYHSASEGVR